MHVYTYKRATADEVKQATVDFTYAIATGLFISWCYHNLALRVIILARSDAAYMATSLPHISTHIYTLPCALGDGAFRLCLRTRLQTVTDCRMQSQPCLLLYDVTCCYFQYTMSEVS